MLEGGDSEICIQRIEEYKGNWANVASAPGYWGEVYMESCENEYFVKVLESGADVRSKMAAVSLGMRRGTPQVACVSDLVKSAKQHDEAVSSYLYRVGLSGGAAEAHSGVWDEIEQKLGELSSPIRFEDSLSRRMCNFFLGGREWKKWRSR